jgi:hypothetical protein
VANQGLPRIKGCLPIWVFGCITIKSVGYSQESTDKTISSKTPSGRILDRLAYSRIKGVGIILVSHNNSVISLVMMFIIVPKSIRVFIIVILSIWTVTVGFSESSYLTGVVTFVLIVFPRLELRGDP